MVAVLFVLLLVVPLAELWVIVQMADRIGLAVTVLLLLAVSVAGAWLLKQQGLATWRRLQSTLRRREVPASEVTDGALILLGGALLLTPGFLTDAVGLVLLLPPTRGALKGAVRRVLARWARHRFGVAGRVYDTVATTRRQDHGSTPPPAPTGDMSSLPRPPRPRGGDSPDRG